MTSCAVRHPSAHMKAHLVGGCLWVMLSEDCHTSLGRKSPRETAQTQQWWNHAHFYILGWHNIIWIALIHFLSYTCWTNSFASIFLSSKSNFQLISLLSLSHRKRKTKFASYKLLKKNDSKIGGKAVQISKEKFHSSSGLVCAVNYSSFLNSHYLFTHDKLAE